MQMNQRNRYFQAALYYVQLRKLEDSWSIQCARKTEVFVSTLCILVLRKCEQKCPMTGSVTLNLIACFKNRDGNVLYDAAENVLSYSVLFCLLVIQPMYHLTEVRSANGTNCNRLLQSRTVNNRTIFSRCSRSQQNFQKHCNSCSMAARW